MRVEIMPLPGATGTDAGFSTAEESAIEVSFLSMIGEATAYMQQDQCENPTADSHAESGWDAPEPSEAPPANTPISHSPQEDSATAAACNRTAPEPETIASPVFSAEPPIQSLLKQYKSAPLHLKFRGSIPGAAGSLPVEVPESRPQNSIEPAMGADVIMETTIREEKAHLQLEHPVIMASGVWWENAALIEGEGDRSADMSLPQVEKASEPAPGSESDPMVVLPEEKSLLHPDHPSRGASGIGREDATPFAGASDRSSGRGLLQVQRIPEATAGSDAVPKVSLEGENALPQLENPVRETSGSWPANDAPYEKTGDRPQDKNMPQSSPATGEEDASRCFPRTAVPLIQAQADVRTERIPLMEVASGTESPDAVLDASLEVSRSDAHHGDSTELREQEGHGSSRKASGLISLEPQESRAIGKVRTGARNAWGMDNPASWNADAEEAAAEVLLQDDSFQRAAPLKGARAGSSEENRQESRAPERFPLPAPVVTGREGRASVQSVGSAAKAPFTETMTLHEPDFLSKMAHRVQIQVRDGHGAVQIQLKPQILGRLEIRAETCGGGVRATIITESQSVRDFLEQNLTALRQSFQEQGLRVDRMQITVADPSVSDRFPGEQSSHEPYSDRGTESRKNREQAQTMPGREDNPEPATTQPVRLPLKPYSTFHTVA